MERKVCSNEIACSCPSVSCANHGHCCDCVAKHKTKGNLPFCLAQMMEEKQS